METLEQYKAKLQYIKDTKEFLKLNPSVDFDDIEERFKRGERILRTIRYILETPEGEDIIVRAEYIMTIFEDE